jgi:flagellar protein FlaI
MSLEQDHPQEGKIFGRSLDNRRTRQLLSSMRQEEAELVMDNQYEVIERYWLVEDFSYAIILRNIRKGSVEYHVVEPTLEPDERELFHELKTQLRDRVLHREDPDIEDPEQVIAKHARDKMNKLYSFDISETSFQRVLYFLKRDLVGYSRIHPLKHDEHLEEISCNGDDLHIYVYHRDHDEHLRTNIVFDESDELERFVSNLAHTSGKDISSASPMQGTDLPDGARVQLTRPEVAPRGANFTVREFREDPFTPTELIKSGTTTAEQMAYLWYLIENKYDGLIVGGTGAGKTTMLNVQSMFIPPGEKIVSIEDTREVELPHENWTSLITRESYANQDVDIDMHDLLQASLRMRPDYIPVGEVRDTNAKALFNAMATGHTSYGTLHADTVPSVLQRLRNEPINISDSQIMELDFICIQIQTEVEDTGETIRRTKGVYEILDVESTQSGGTELNYNQVFDWGPEADEIYRTSSESRHLAELEAEEGLRPHEAIEERTEILEWLAKKDVTDYLEVTPVLRAYMQNPAIVRDQMEDDELDIIRLREFDEG